MEYDFSRRLPTGIQDFEQLRTEGYLYVDKTEHLYRLVNLCKQCFLSRPRRFGKSLFLSTLRTFFEGKRELFEGLAIAALEKEWKEYPVLYFDFLEGTYTDKDALKDTLASHLGRYEELWGGEPHQESIALRFKALIVSAYNRAKMPVVILVDEYDKPLLGTMNDASAQAEMRELLGDFYSVLKPAGRYLRFVMWTGVTKFAKTSIFSGFNQPDDISMLDEYAGICGISESEMKAVFMPEIEALASKQKITIDETLAKLRKQYDGYHFSATADEGLYNPFSLLHTLKNKLFSDYWFSTGTPTFLIKMVKDARLDFGTLDCGEQKIASGDIDIYRADSTNPIPLMYQSGYLTITGYDFDTNEYLLGFPNEEVRSGFVRGLLELYLDAQSRNLTEFAAIAFACDLREERLADFRERLTAFFASISYDLSNKTEKDFQTILTVLLTATGYVVHPERRSSYGRSDIVLELPKAVYIFELKISNNGTAADALRQIDAKGYAAPYLASEKKIIRIGIEIDGETRTIRDWCER